MNAAAEIPKSLIARPDGSYVDLNKLEARYQLAHELVVNGFARADALSEQLAATKQHVLTEMRAYRDVLLQDYEVDVTGREGGFSIKSACGTRRIELSISKHVSFGPELVAAKALIDEFLEGELAGSSVVIKDIVTDAFKLNAKGRLNTDGILGLRKHQWDNPLWKRAMAAIDDAICRDSATTYLRFYNINTLTKAETIVPLDLAKV